MAELASFEELRDAVAAPVVEEAPKREPQRDSLGRSYATGKRKDAVARVWIKPGNGKVVVNGKEMKAYFARPVLQMVIGQAFSVAGVAGEFDVMATVKGGGLSGQAGAVKHGISQALSLYEPSLRPALKAVERMLPGGPLSRKQMGNLRVYGGAEHPHAAQNPEVIDLAARNPKNTRSA